MAWIRREYDGKRMGGNMRAEKHAYLHRGLEMIISKYT